MTYADTRPAGEVARAASRAASMAAAAAEVAANSAAVAYGGSALDRRPAVLRMTTAADTAAMLARQCATEARLLLDQDFGPDTLHTVVALRDDARRYARDAQRAALAATY